MPPTAGVDDRPTCPHTPLMNLTRREPCDGLDRQAEEQEGRNGRRSQGTAWQGDRRRRVGARRQDRPDQEQPQAGWREGQGRLKQGLRSDRPLASPSPLPVARTAELASWEGSSVPTGQWFLSSRARGNPSTRLDTVSYTHLTLPTNREVKISVV